MAERWLHHSRVQCHVFHQSCMGNTSTASPPHTGWQPAGCPSAAYVAGASTTARVIASGCGGRVWRGTTYQATWTHPVGVSVTVTSHALWPISRAWARTEMRRAWAKPCWATLGAAAKDTDTDVDVDVAADVGCGQGMAATPRRRTPLPLLTVQPRKVTVSPPARYGTLPSSIRCSHTTLIHAHRM